MSLEKENSNSRNGDNNMNFILIILFIVFVISLIAIIGSRDPSFDENGRHVETHSLGGHVHKVAYFFSRPLYRIGYQITHLGNSPEDDQSKENSNRNNDDNDNDDNYGR